MIATGIVTGGSLSTRVVYGGIAPSSLLGLLGVLTARCGRFAYSGLSVIRGRDAIII